MEADDGLSAHHDEVVGVVEVQVYPAQHLRLGDHHVELTQRNLAPRGTKALGEDPAMVGVTVKLS